jgi:DNA-binding response OmpR family regulator
MNTSRFEDQQELPELAGILEKILFLTNVDHGAAEAMTKLLHDNGYGLMIRRTVEDWHEDPSSNDITLVIISQQLPFDYLETCRIIRSSSSVPIIVLSERSDTVDMVVALEMGADDYMAVPYERLGLVARIRALLRRSIVGEEGDHTPRTKSATDLIVIGPLRIDCNFRDAFVQEQPVGLTNLEFKLLHHFVLHQEVLLTKEEIFTSIWGYDLATNSHSLATYIHLLKKKLRSHGVWLPLENMRGIGYKLGPATIINLFPIEDEAVAREAETG